MAGVIEPDDTPPAGSYEASVENLSTWSARSENQWKDITRGNARSGYDNAADGRNDLFSQLTSVAAGLANVVSDLADVVGGIFDGWFGGGSTGDPLEVGYTIQAIRDAVVGGSTVITVTSSGTRAIPSTVTECFAIVVGGGENGQNGYNEMTSSDPGIMSLGGRGGSYAAVPLDVTTVKGQTLTLTIGSNGGRTSVNLGATELVGIQCGNVGGIASGVLGYTPTTSAPGNGGNGGYGSSANGNHLGVAGLPGTPSATAVQGAGGTYNNSGAGGNGGTGGNADPAAAVKSCGAGGGGGGGGGSRSLAGDSGSGGPGGYPGAGGGGGGAGAHGGLAGSGDNSPGGIGAPGIAWLIYK
ncbi:minor tail protein [Gordonia phage Fryberger]|uniref:Minor tail protein n=1 Tax=Gordonia phage Fryberger TaxID=2250392 RepID=A0A346FCK9_9CAUD|nr:minor tail protein [Gordonia phage Fryberger]AXN53473.1 hypothetical protein SEA_FRYBERGER_55 [Gordonia phage Fryberger]